MSLIQTKPKSQRSEPSRVSIKESQLMRLYHRFSLKFQQIVQAEQEANFISRLHRGRINIIPWPVIESQQFYSLFPTVKRCLDREPVTHPRAGVFLQTMKTLMAKLKVRLNHHYPPFIISQVVGEFYEGK